MLEGLITAVVIIGLFAAFIVFGRSEVGKARLKQSLGDPFPTYKKPKLTKKKPGSSRTASANGGASRTTTKRTSR